MNNEKVQATKRKHEAEETPSATEAKEANSHPPDLKGNSPIFQIIKDLENLKEKQNQLSGHFDEWCIQRKKTIVILEDALKKLKTASKIADASRFVVLGLLFAKLLINCFCQPSRPQASRGSKKHKASHSASSSDGNENVLVYLASNLSIPMINLVEIGFNEYFLSEVRAALDKDQELSKPINEWIRSTRDLENRVMQNLGVSLTSTPILKVISSINSAVQMFRSGKKDAAIQEFQSIAGSKAVDVLSELTSDCNLEELATILNKASTALSDAPDGLEKICTDGLKLGEAFKDFNLISVLGILPKMLNDEGSEVVGIFLDAVNVVQKFQKCISEEESQHSKRVEHVLEFLNKQLEEVSNIFNPKC